MSVIYKVYYCQGLGAAQPVPPEMPTGRMERLIRLRRATPEVRVARKQRAQPY